MKSKENVLWSIFKLYGILYVLLYIGYIFIINILDSSYSIVSIPAILVPYVFLLFFLFVLWKYTNWRTERKAKTKFITRTTIGIIPPLFCAIILGVNEYKSNFSVKKWLINESERVYMVDDLLNEYELIGMTKKEVSTLLGPTEADDYFKEENNIVYYLGNERSLISIDSEWLVITFDENKKVVKYEVVTD
ncbi:hypothetical protein [Niallia sp. 01092]|uniref:hypothetical protein n=1 Tax=unclassified Niallia TaxID=2837522 RepID=UPI003FD0C375